VTVAILLALVASLFTATSSVAQRVAAAPAPGEIQFSWRLLTFLLRRPVWFLGIVCMIGGFVFQVAALHRGDLSLVQPVIAAELLFVFAYLALRNRHRVHTRDWVAAFGMAAGLGGFLFLADPHGGSAAQASGWLWLLGGIATFAAAAAVAGLAYLPVRGTAPSPARRAALLSISAGIAWGFVAAVVKELSLHVGHGLVPLVTNWSPYVLIISGAAAMFLVTNAFQAGPLAASQPGLTIADPLVASLLGVTIFGEHLRTGPFYLAGECLAALVLLAGVVLLSRSSLIQTSAASAETSPPTAGLALVGAKARREDGHSEGPAVADQRPPSVAEDHRSAPLGAAQASEGGRSETALADAGKAPRCRRPRARDDDPGETAPAPFTWPSRS
jgi:drug/metabolite transporter (DMT)-like permease